VKLNTEVTQTTCVMSARWLA